MLTEDRDDEVLSEDIYQWISANVTCFGSEDESDADDVDLHTQEYLMKIYWIEKFVELVLSNKNIGYAVLTDSRKCADPKMISLTSFFQGISNLNQLRRAEYKYSSLVELFFTCYSMLNLDEQLFLVSESVQDIAQRYKLYHEFLKLIQSEGEKPSFKRKVELNKYKHIRRLRSATAKINKLFDIYSRIQVLRIDFGYSAECTHSVTVEQAKNDLERFMANRRHKPKLFAKCVHYIAKLEWAPSKGFHYHMIFFYKGRDIQKDIYWTKQIGEYWKEVVLKNECGTYFNCNGKQHQYKRLGIGLIERTDMEKRYILINIVVAYLVKSDQYLRAVRLGNVRCFNQGVPHKKSNAGRPRDEDLAPTINLAISN